MQRCKPSLTVKLEFKVSKSITDAFGSAIANIGGASCVLTLNYTKNS